MGSGAGIVSAIAWFVATEVARRTGVVDWMLDTRVAREARMRDLVVEEDLVAPGWERWEKKRRHTLDENAKSSLAKKAR